MTKQASDLLTHEKVVLEFRRGRWKQEDPVKLVDPVKPVKIYLRNET